MPDEPCQLLPWIWMSIRVGGQVGVMARAAIDFTVGAMWRCFCREPYRRELHERGRAAAAPRRTERPAAHRGLQAGRLQEC